MVLVAATGVALSGDRQAKVMTEVQPMKMAAAEALYESKESAGFSIFTVGTLEGKDEVFSLRIPGLLSFLGKGSFSAPIEGVNDIQATYAAKYGPGDYTPNIPLTYWTFRLMMGVGMSSALAAVWVLWSFRKGRLPRNRWCGRLALLLPLTPLFGNAFGWIFTEMGRQPWIVFGLMPTSAGVSPGVGTTGTASLGDPATAGCVGLFLVGVGWSFGLVAGSPLLTESVPADTRVELQGAGDLLMSLFGGAAAFSSGFVKASFGYSTLAYAGTLLAGVLLVYSMASRTAALRRSPAS